jgi:hypothetical protein
VFGSVRSVAGRLDIARPLLSAGGARERLLERPSYRQFAAQAVSWHR